MFLTLQESRVCCICSVVKGATNYFKEKTSDEIYDAFKPIISSSMNEVGVTRSYKQMMDTYTSLPLASAQSLDLDHYVTNQALDGLFQVLAQEEKKIRTDPAARTTDLLKKVFGRYSFSAPLAPLR